MVTLTPSQVRNVLRLVNVERSAMDVYSDAPSTETRENWTDAADVLLAYCEHIGIDSDVAGMIDDRRADGTAAIIAFVQDLA